MLTFDEATHTYLKNGVPVPSVTTVLKPLYGDLRFVQQDLLDYKSALGQAVHKAIELHVNCELDYSTLVDPVRHYFEQYLKFERETGFTPTHSEQRVHSALGYAGTLDLAGLLNDRRGLIDIKTTATISPAVALQTAAYQHAFNESRPVDERAFRRYALRLTPDRYILHPFANDAQDLAGFVGFLKVYQWLKANNIKHEEFTHV